MGSICCLCDVGCRLIFRWWPGFWAISSVSLRQHHALHYCVILLFVLPRLIWFEMKDWKGIFRYSLHSLTGKNYFWFSPWMYVWKHNAFRPVESGIGGFAKSLVFTKYDTWVCKGSFPNGTLLRWLVKAERCDENFLNQISNSMYKQKDLHFNNYPWESNL